MVAKSTIDIVTGATQGIGKAIAESIAHHRCKVNNTAADDSSVSSLYKLILVGRNATRGERVAGDIAKATGLTVVFESVDLSDYSQIQAMVSKHFTFDQDDTQVARVGILVNSAAECPRQQQMIELKRKGTQQQEYLDTVDKQFATNVLGYHFMLSGLKAYFQNSHVVMVASNWAGDLDLTDVNFQRRRYDNDTAYRQSKQCNRMLASIWAKELKGRAFVNSCHPGDPCTTLSTSL